MLASARSRVWGDHIRPFPHREVKPSCSVWPYRHVPVILFLCRPAKFDRRDARPSCRGDYLPIAASPPRSSSAQDGAPCPRIARPASARRSRQGRGTGARAQIVLRTSTRALTSPPRVRVELASRSEISWQKRPPINAWLFHNSHRPGSDMLAWTRTRWQWSLFGEVPDRKADLRLSRRRSAFVRSSKSWTAPTIRSRRTCSSAVRMG